MRTPTSLILGAVIAAGVFLEPFAALAQPVRSPVAPNAVATIETTLKTSRPDGPTALTNWWTVFLKRR
jgi:hypothetical protein